MKLKKVLSAILAAAMVLSTMSFTVFAESTTVSTDAELTAALAAATEGDVITLKAGTYEPFFVDVAGITIKGEDENNKPVISTNYEEATTNSPWPSSGGVVIRAENVTFENLAFESEGYLKYWNSACIGNPYDGKGSGKANGTTILNCDFNCDVEDFTGTAIVLSGATNVTVSGCTITGFAGGYAGEGTVSNANINAVFTDNTITVPEGYTAIAFTPYYKTGVAAGTVTMTGNTTNGKLMVWDYGITADNTAAVAEIILDDNTTDAVIVKDIDSSNTTVTTADEYAYQYTAVEVAETYAPVDTEVLIGYNTADQTLVKSEDGTTTITELLAASITKDEKTTKYETLEEAIAAAEDGDTIEILRDVETDSIAITKAITIDMNGYTITPANPLSKQIEGAWIVAKGADVTFENGTFDITGINVATAVFATGVYTGGAATLTFNNVTVTGDNYTANYRVFYSNAGNITINDSTVDLANDTSDARIFGGEGVHEITITNSEITLENVAGAFTNAEVTITDTTIEMTDLNDNAMRNISGTITDTTIAVDGAETGIKNTNGKELEINGDSDVSIKNTTLGDIILQDTADAEGNAVATEIKVNDTASLTAENVDSSSAEKIAVAETATVTLRTAEIEVAFEKASDDNSLYNIVLRAESAKEINRLTAADLTFVFEQTEGRTGTTMSYEIVKLADKNIEINEVAANRYEFHFDGETVADETSESITIAQVKFNGYGKFTFKVADAETNAVQATTLEDNIVDTYIVGGDVDNGEGNLVINENVSDKDPVDSEGNTDGKSDGVIDTEVAVPTHTLKVDVQYNNNLSADTTKEYKNMVLTISGGDIETVTPVVLEDDGKLATYETELTENITYTVTIEGAGYRTAKYNVTMTTDKKLTFWNNVKDNAFNVEENKDASAKNVTFLAGDIVKDGQINIYDLSAVVSYFGEIDIDTATDDVKASYVKYDLNRDGKINSKDVAYVLVSWGK